MMFKWLSNRYKLSFESHYNFRFFRSVRNKKNQYISFFLGITFRFSDYIRLSENLRQILFPL